MPDAGPQHALPSKARRTCVIGAGVSGLVAAKVLLGRGHDVHVVERGGDLGGVWEPARSYPGVRTQTPRDLYSFTDAPMPSEYPEWPSGTQVHAYLDAYAHRFGLRPRIRFRTEVLLLQQRPGRDGWFVTLRQNDPGADAAEVVEHYDAVVVATGQFSQPRTLPLPGEADFRAAGGQVQHSSEHVEAGQTRGRDVVVVGFSKSATDVAMNALDEGARTVTLVYREAAWKIPYFFGGAVNFKRILYCRASEAMFAPWAPSRAGRLLRRLLAPAIWANWRALEALLEVQFGLRKAGLRPRGRIEDGIHCATAIETPGFYRAVRERRIRAVQGEPAGYEPGAVVVGGVRLPADLVVLAIGWRQNLPFLDEDTRAKLIEPDGQYRLHRMIVNPDLPGLGFVGFNSSFVSTLSAELGAHWLARFLDGALRRQPTDADMRAGIAQALDWRRHVRGAAAEYGGLCVAPYHHAHFDELMADMGAQTRRGGALAAHLAPISPAAYAELLETAPGRDPAAAEGSAR